jgi:hypothetical protein
MAERNIYTRVYSSSSAGQLASGKGPSGPPLSRTALLQEFQTNADNQNRKPTALVSCSDRIVDTLNRAFEKYHRHGDAATDIWIAFVEVPPAQAGFHAARKLADICKFSEPYLFSHEFVFEWAIPEKYVVHKVSLQTLCNRGLSEDRFSKSPTKIIQSSIAKDLRLQGPWEIGVSLGSFAQNFGARAPLEWISHQLFYDCVWTKSVDDKMIALRYADQDVIEYEDFEFWHLLEDGIDTSLYDWWLADGDSFPDYDEFDEWQDVLENDMIDDLTEFLETWHDVDCDGTVKELSAKQYSVYVIAKKELLTDHERKRADIEAEAVKMGL